MAGIIHPENARIDKVGGLHRRYSLSINLASYLVSLRFFPSSELELEGELDGAGAADLVEGVEAAVGAARAETAGQCLGRLAEERAGQAVAGVPEVGVIEDIEELGTEAQAQLLRQRKAPLKGHIRLRGSESTQDVAAEIALGSRRRRDERGLVEDFAPWILRAE